MGFTDTKPFSRAGQFRLVAILTAAVFALCVKAVWHESTLLAIARSEMPLNQVFNPDGRTVLIPTDDPALAEGVVEIDLSEMGPPNLWLIERQPDTWTITFEDPEAPLIPGSSLAKLDLNNTRFMGPFRATIWTEPMMGLWASTCYRLDQEFNWVGQTQHGMSLKEIRKIIADQWTTGGQLAIDSFANGGGTQTDSPSGTKNSALSFTPRYLGYAMNAASLGSLLSTLGLVFASFLIRSRTVRTNTTTSGSTPKQGSQNPHRSAA